MLDAVERLVLAESPSEDVGLLEACAKEVSEVGADATGAPAQIVRVDGRPHLSWQFGARTRVALIGHFDTVWPAGTLSVRPFSVAGGMATGPGVFDMKSGIVQLFEALATLEDLDGVTVVLTSDEELGSQTSRHLVESAAAGAAAALLFEPSAAGALKTARKGTGMYTLRVDGRAAHAGLEPEKGVNALVEAAHLVLRVAALGRDSEGTTVTPTMAAAGTATNVVPDRAVVEVDVRAWSAAEADRVDAAVRGLAATVPGAVLTVAGGPNRPPFSRAASEGLFALAEAAASRLGVPDLSGVAVGGGSDGNFTAAMGTPTLDGLGAVGDGAHAVSEHLVVDSMPWRAALAAELLTDLLAVSAR